MSTRRCAVLGLLCALAFWPPAAPAGAQQSARLIVVPSQAPQGDTVYLSGGGLPPNQDAPVLIFCKSWYQAFYGEWVMPRPVHTGPTGTFAGYSIKVPTPLRVRTSPCQIYVKVGDNPFGTGAKLTILPPGTTAAPHTFKISVHVVTRRVGGTIQEHMTVRGAPGARVTVTERYPDHTVAQRHLLLPWTGSMSRQWTARVESGRSGRVIVAARGRLGNFVGSTSTFFLI